VAIDQITQMHDGHVSLDELWTILDARASASTRNRFVADIMLKSRKRDLTIMFTTQLLDMLDKRVRKIMDFTAYTLLNRVETLGKCFIFRGGYPKDHMLLKSFMFYTQPVFGMFNTNQEIQMEESSDNAPMKIVFQESPEKPPKYFDTWEDCDHYAEKWWEKNGKELLSFLITGQ
jgi:hypothetical protein